VQYGKYPLLGNYNGRELILAIASRLEKTKEQVETLRIGL
jgi:hypothetical protein